MLDKKDLKILNILRENSKLTTSQISKRTAIPITTVYNRIRKMEKEGVIRSYSVVLDNSKIERGVGAYVMITFDHKRLRETDDPTQFELTKKLKKHPFVEEACMVTGEPDILLKIRVKDINALGDFVTKELRSYEGIDKTQTMVILKEV